MTVTDAIRSSATVEEEHERMLHPERCERAAEVLTKAPSGDTEFTTAQQAGSSGGPLPEGEPRGHSTEAHHGPEELWDESFKPPSALARADSPTSTLADRFVSAGGSLSRQPCMSLQASALSYITAGRCSSPVVPCHPGEVFSETQVRPCLSSIENDADAAHHSDFQKSDLGSSNPSAIAAYHAAEDLV